MPFTPYEAAIDCVSRAERLLKSADEKVNSAIAGDLRRLGIVMGIAALDTYMHRLIIDRAYRHKRLPGKLAKLSFSFAYALDRADDCAEAARLKPHHNRPRVALKRALRDRLLLDSFQRYDDVSDALGMAGMSGNWNKIGDQLSPPLQPEELREKLDAIVNRRNQIAHEGDYVRLERPQTSRKNRVSAREASADVRFLRDLINAMHKVSRA